MRKVKTLGLLGTGVIGGGWAARALHFGIDVIAAQSIEAGKPLRLVDTVVRPEWMDPKIRARLESIRAGHAGLPLPPEAGRSVGRAQH